ncbi:MAG: hypothetical protein WC505_06885 [Patescibacteria group bacterium]
MPNNSFWSNELVQTGPDTWEVRYGKHQGQRQKVSAARNREAGVKPAQHNRVRVYKYFLDRRHKTITDAQGNVVARRVTITQGKKLMGHKQTLVRFMMDGLEWAGRTVLGGKNALVLRPGRRKIAKCPCGKTLKSDNATGLCRECRKKETQSKNKTCTECGKAIRDQNVTGLCAKHYRESKHAAEQKRNFNPFAP